MEIILKILAVVMLLIVSFFLFLAAVRFYLRKKNEISQKAGIDLMETVELGGIKQSIYIRGHDRNNPVLLFLHGGPGYTKMPLLYTFQRELESHFTIVHWDQRLSGKTYFINSAKIEDSLETRVEDTKELIEKLLKKLNKDKIILLGYSFGSVIGIKTVKKYPELCEAYFGVAQVVNYLKGERIGYEKTVIEAETRGDKKSLAVLNGFADFSNEEGRRYHKDFKDNLKVLNGIKSKYGLESKWNTFDLLFSPYYTLKETTYFFKDTYEISSVILKDFIETFDMAAMELDFKIPVFFILGDNDWTTPASLVEEIFDRIEAPVKKKFMIPASHNIMGDNKDAFCRTLIDILKEYIK